MKSAATTFNAWHHRTAVFTAFATLVVTGAGVEIQKYGIGIPFPLR
jgi:divalent metal cation (Fe/Co/Zn/Cd) transporter